MPNLIPPTIGRIVLVRGPQLLGITGTAEHPAIITSVSARDTINVTAFLDGRLATLPLANVAYHEPDDGDTGWRWHDDRG